VKGLSSARILTGPSA